MQNYFTFVSIWIEITDVCYEEELYAVLAIIYIDTRKIFVGAKKALRWLPHNNEHAFYVGPTVHVHVHVRSCQWTKLGAQVDGSLLKYVIKFHHMIQVLPSTENVCNHNSGLASGSLPIMLTQTSLSLSFSLFFSLYSSGAANMPNSENGERQKGILHSEDRA